MQNGPECINWSCLIVSRIGDFEKLQEQLIVLQLQQSLNG